MKSFLQKCLATINQHPSAKLAQLGITAALVLSTPNIARADGIYMTNMKSSLTPNSVSLLTDPARPGGVQAGDIVEYMLQAQVANAAGGPGVYFTAYIPNGVEVLGAWFVTDATGATVGSPSSGGHAHDGWGPRGSKTPFGPPFAKVLNSRQNDLYGDTGIFYSTSSLTQLFTSTFLRGEIDGRIVKPGDTIEYTIYFPNTGGSNANNVRVCDRITGEQQFTGTTLQLQQNGAAPTILTSGPELDRATFYASSSNPAITSCNFTGTPPIENGAIVVDVTGATGSPAWTTLPSSTGAGTTDTYGLIRFTTKVNQ
jgi:uncharacterized repeat protein (TIGR01451 family)